MNKVIAIGALGGSGTRAVAQVLIEAGVYMGDDLNQPNDNLIFTRLFKNPHFYKKAQKHEVNTRLRAFEEYMETDHLSLKNAFILLKSAINNPTFKQNKKLYKNILRKLFNPFEKREVWGWKEPNTQIYIEEICKYFESLKYIHVVRHGLDMAFSDNKQQLINWGYKYGIYLRGNETEDELSYLQLDYWVKSTEESLAKGRILGDNLLLLNFTQFCQNPQEEIDRILSFTGLCVSEKLRMELYKIPKVPSSPERYKYFNLSIFDKDQIDFVKTLGFEV